MKTILTGQKIMNFISRSKNFEKVLEKVNILSIGNGKCTAELKLEPEHTNAIGTLHGGYSATLVDILSTYALLSHEKGEGTVNVSVDMNMTYIKSAVVGETIVINANTLKAGKTLAFLEVDIKNKNGDLLVKGSHTKYIMP